MNVCYIYNINTLLLLTFLHNLVFQSACSIVHAPRYNTNTFPVFIANTNFSRQLSIKSDRFTPPLANGIIRFDVSYYICI